MLGFSRGDRSAKAKLVASSGAFNPIRKHHLQIQRLLGHKPIKTCPHVQTCVLHCCAAIQHLQKHRKTVSTSPVSPRPPCLRDWGQGFRHRRLDLSEAFLGRHKHVMFLKAELRRVENQTKRHGSLGLHRAHLCQRPQEGTRRQQQGLKQSRC